MIDECIYHASEEAEFRDRAGDPYIEITGQAFYPIFKLIEVGKPKPPEV